jgi:O-acetyl-ADP-ribose deacetylase (regulator of RNase III)
LIQFVRGNLFDSQAEALVNAVNTVGVMGRGVALEFKHRFPENYRAYRAACKREEIVVGKMFTFELNRETSLERPRWIINFPTKQHWRNPSKLEFVRDGLEDLVRVIEAKKISSVALPALGCGTGGLDWKTVRELLGASLEPLDHVAFEIFEPGAEKVIVR